MEFWLALFTFLTSHSALSWVGLRALIVKKWGEKAYLILYSILSTILLVWLIVAAQNAPRIQIWPWLHELYWIPNMIMPFACILLMLGFIVPNPLSIIPRNKNFNPERPSFAIVLTRHPTLWGFFLWSTSHIIPNGEYPLVIMFVIFSIFSLLGLVITDKKLQKDLGHKTWNSMAKNTHSFIFLSPSLWRGKFQFTKYDAIGIFLGLFLHVILYYMHGLLFNISAMPPL